MNARRQRTLTGIRPLENLEGRLALSTAANPLHELVASQGAQADVAQLHKSSRKAPAIPNPVLVNLTPGVTGVVITDVTYDPRVHLLTVKGTRDVSSFSLPSFPYYPFPGYPSPSYPYTTTIYVTASQAAKRAASVSDSQTSNVSVPDASIKTVKFTEKIVAGAGKFASGNFVISVNSSYPYYYSTAQSFIVRPRRVNAY